MGKLQQILVQPDSVDLSEQCKEETGLTVEELCKAEPLESVLQQVRETFMQAVGLCLYTVFVYRMSFQTDA